MTTRSLLYRKCGFTCASVAAIDTHRTGSFGEPIYKTSSTGKSRHVIGHLPRTRRCPTLQELLILGIAQNTRGWWTLLKQGVSTSERARA